MTNVDSSQQGATTPIKNMHPALLAILLIVAGVALGVLTDPGSAPTLPANASVRTATVR